MTWAPLTDAEFAVFEATLRAQLDTPWRHQGRKGCGYGHQTGLDCVGMAVLGVLALGRPVADLDAYPTDPDGTLEDRITAHLGAPEFPAVIAPRRLVSMRFGGQPRHVAYISTAGTLIHAFGTRKLGGKVQEHGIDAVVRRCIVRSWPL
jgi:hypothetical protein